MRAVVLACLLVLMNPDSSRGDNATPITFDPPSPETFVDPSSGATFPLSLTAHQSGETVTFKALGSGVRKKLIFKVYAAALYTDQSVDLGRDPTDRLTNDDLPRRMVLFFLRDGSRKQVQEAFEEGFEKAWAGAVPGPELQKDLDAFRGYFEAGVKKGETVEFTYWPGVGLQTRVAGRDRAVITNPKIARSLWFVWLGPTPVSEKLRDELVRFVSPQGR